LGWKNGAIFRSFSPQHHLNPLLKLSERLSSRGTQRRLSPSLTLVLFSTPKHTSSIAQHLAKREGFVLAIGRIFRSPFLVPPFFPLGEAEGISKSLTFRSCFMFYACVFAPLSLAHFDQAQAFVVSILLCLDFCYGSSVLFCYG